MPKEQLMDLLKRLLRDVREDRVVGARLELGHLKDDNFAVQFSVNYHQINLSEGVQQSLPLE